MSEVCDQVTKWEVVALQVGMTLSRQAFLAVTAAVLPSSHGGFGSDGYSAPYVFAGADVRFSVLFRPVSRSCYVIHYVAGIVRK